MDDGSNFKYDDSEITPYEDRGTIDDLIDKVHQKHEQPKASTAYEVLLKQYSQLPNGSGSDRGYLRYKLGEALVNFYTYELRPEEVSDEESECGRISPLSGRRRPSRQNRPSRQFYQYIPDDIEDGSSSDNDEYYRAPEPRIKRAKTTPIDVLLPKDDASTTAVERGKPKYFAVPLQYLYGFPPRDGASPPTEPAMDIDRVPFLKSEDTTHLRIIEFPAQYYATEFIDAMKHRKCDSTIMKHISMAKLINNPDSPMSVFTSKDDKNSKFLTGVSCFPYLPRDRVVSHRVRGAYLPETILFVAIPYLGLQPISIEHYRTKSPLRPANLEGERLTAYHLVNNVASACVSSLKLLDYRYRRTKNPRMEPTKLSGNDEDEVMIVHQVWFMVLDEANIAAFRSASDIQAQHAPLFPQNYPSVGAYHALINMMDSIMPSGEATIREKFGHKIIELENLGSDDESQGNNYRLLMSKVKSMRTELLTMRRVVETQIHILRSLKRFQLEAHEEQLNVMRKTINQVIKKRKFFSETIEDLLQQLDDVRLEQADNLQIKMMETAEKQEKAQNTLVKKQEEAEKKQEEAVKRQVNTAQLQQKISTKASVFTFVTVVFLPLSFLTSYFGMNLEDIKEGPKNWKHDAITQQMFWLYFFIPIALVTIIITYITVLCRWTQILKTRPKLPLEMFRAWRFRRHVRRRKRLETILDDARLPRDPEKQEPPPVASSSSSAVIGDPSVTNNFANSRSSNEAGDRLVVSSPPSPARSSTSLTLTI